MFVGICISEGREPRPDNVVAASPPLALVGICTALGDTCIALGGICFALGGICITLVGICFALVGICFTLVGICFTLVGICFALLGIRFALGLTRSLTSAVATESTLVLFGTIFVFGIISFVRVGGRRKW